MKKLVIILSILLIQIYVISFLIYKIFIVHENILGVQTSITPIVKEDLIFTPGNELKYFYEPRANSVDNRKREWLDYTPYITINSDTLNSSREFSVDKPKNTFRIITLGDSFTFGGSVSTSDNYPSQLEEILNKTCKTDLKFEIINLGVSGYDFQYIIERFRKRGVKYNSDLIIWGIISDDFTRYREKMEELFHNKYTIEILEERENRMVDANQNEIWQKARNEVLETVGGEQILLEFAYQQLQLLRTYYSKPLILVALTDLTPTQNNILTQYANMHKDTYLHRSVNLYSSSDLHITDLHPSPIGHKAIAEDLFNYLNSNKLIPCNN